MTKVEEDAEEEKKPVQPNIDDKDDSDESTSGPRKPYTYKPKVEKAVMNQQVNDALAKAQALLANLNKEKSPMQERFEKLNAKMTAKMAFIFTEKFKPEEHYKSEKLICTPE